MARLVSTYDAIRFSVTPKKPYLKYKAKKASREGEPALELLRFLVPENCNAIDGGANKGIYSYYLSKLCKQVHAFEPNPAMNAYLKSAVPGNVTTYQMALSDFTGTAQFNLPTDKGRFHHSAGSLMDVSGKTGAANFEVEVTTIDSFGFDNIGFIKLDLEGQELAALKGGCDLLERCRPAVIAEATGVGGSSPEELVDFMLGLDYAALVLNDGRLRHYGDNTGKKIIHNVIFLPRES